MKHPLANKKEPLYANEINQYPAVYVNDSARQMPEQNYDVQSSSQQIIVGSVGEKAATIIAGIGVGFLPRKIAQYEMNQNHLIIKKVELSRSSVQLAIAWHIKNSDGMALKWWTKKLQDPKIKKSLFG